METSYAEGLALGIVAIVYLGIVVLDQLFASKHTFTAKVIHINYTVPVSSHIQLPLGYQREYWAVHLQDVSNQSSFHTCVYQLPSYNQGKRVTVDTCVGRLSGIIYSKVIQPC